MVGGGRGTNRPIQGLRPQWRHNPDPGGVRFWGSGKESRSLHDNDSITNVRKDTTPGGGGCQIKTVPFYPFLDGWMDLLSYIGMIDTYNS